MRKFIGRCTHVPLYSNDEVYLSGTLKQDDLSQRGAGESTPEPEATGPKSLQANEKAPFDLFKAVFQDTDSESSSSEGNLLN